MQTTKALAIIPEKVAMTKKRDAYGKKPDLQIGGLSPEINLPGAREDKSKAEEKIEFYKKVQAARRAGKMQEK
jgi:hypothetical protein